METRDTKGRFAPGIGFWTGKKRPSISGDRHPNKRPENALKISIGKTGKLRPDMVGENNWNYTGRDMKKAKMRVLLREDFTCRSCGLREPEIMQVDHIEPMSRRPDLSLEEANMQVLCPNCHARKTYHNHDKRKM